MSDTTVDGGERDGGEDELSLEERLRRLEEIVRDLEGGDVALERGLALFEEGVKHLRAAEKVLAAAELRVQELIGEEGETELREMSSGDGVEE